MTHEVAPQDPFKQTFVAKSGFKEVPNKVNYEMHCSDAALLKKPDVNFGYQHQVTWSQQTNEMRCQGDARTFDKIVANSQARETA